MMISRRTILTAAATAAVAQTLPAFAIAPAAAESTGNMAADTSIAREWLLKWGNAWNSHDAHQMVLLHTEDAVTINRFGTLVPGREPLEKALGYLHAVHGPYHDTTLPPLQLLGVRQIAPKVMILQATWKSPVMNSDGKLDLSK